MHEIISLIDLTSLSETDTQESIAKLCQKAKTPQGYVAAICVYPKFVKQVAATIGAATKIATVVNFPQGDDALETIVQTIKLAIQDGANEIDMVFPYQRYLAGDKQGAQEIVRTCKAACGEAVLLKVILETGALQDLAIIAAVSRDAIDAGADFLKTSTGKIKAGATLAAVATMLKVIKEMHLQVKRPLSCKVSGGVRNLEQAEEYLAIAKQIMGEDWLNAQTFRLGTSQLLDSLNIQ